MVCSMVDREVIGIGWGWGGVGVLVLGGRGSGCSTKMNFSVGIASIFVRAAPVKDFFLGFLFSI